MTPPGDCHPKAVRSLMTSTRISTPHKGGGIPVPGQPPVTTMLKPEIKLVTGILQSVRHDWCEEPQEQGLKLVVIERGQLRCRVDGQPEHTIKGPGVCFLANETAYSTRLSYDCTTPLHYTIVQLGAGLLDPGQGLLPPALLPTYGTTRLLSCPASSGLRTLAAQIATCPLQGGMRQFYLGGKALELAAVGMQLLGGGQAVRPAVIRMTSSDIDRIHAARDLLFAALQEPPSLPELAARVGLNVRKLTAGFRKVFGSSAFALLAEQRLREAHRMLCEEEVNISTIAHRVGYSPAHFSAAFRKRYHLSPREIRPIRLADF